MATKCTFVVVTCRAVKLKRLTDRLFSKFQLGHIKLIIRLHKISYLFLPLKIDQATRLFIFHFFQYRASTSILL